MKVCTSCFERGSRPVVGSSSSSRTGDVSRARERHFLLHAAREVLHRLATARRREADPLEDHRDLRVRLARPHAVEPRRVGEVLGRAHLLEEARLDRDAVDEAAHRARVLEHVVAEDLRAATVGQEQRREQPHERRLARAVLAENGDAFAALHREADAVERRAATAADQAFPPSEDLCQVTDCNCTTGHTMLLRIVRRETERRRTSTAVSGEVSRFRWRSRTQSGKNMQTHP